MNYMSESIAAQKTQRDACTVVLSTSSTQPKCLSWRTVKSQLSAGAICDSGAFTGKPARSVAPPLSGRRGCCSPRQSNRTDGRPHPPPPRLGTRSEHRERHTGPQADRENTHTQKAGHRVKNKTA